MQITRLLFFSALSLALATCVVIDREALEYGDEESVAVVYADVETLPVPSLDDAADDPAIWIHPTDPSQSLILGTDKRSGLAIYRLDGSQKQFIPAGLPNNVDLRQNLSIGNWRGDLAAASNRAADTVTLFAINADGGEILGEFPSPLVEPYGSCMGIVSGVPLIFVTYQTGEVYAFRINSIDNGFIEQLTIGTHNFESQLEGCVHDDISNILYVGEEERGLWRTQLTLQDSEVMFSEPVLVDTVDSNTGIVADVEGVAIYKGDSGSYVIASSQGNDSYAVYQHNADGNQFIGRFRIRSHVDGSIDGAQETDGLEASAVDLGSSYPEGVLIVQDGFNAPRGTAQNFKLVDWRDIANALGLH